jgi:glutamate/tyrosine decarboxylase-like PLP-dependent enzyme
VKTDLVSHEAGTPEASLDPSTPAEWEAVRAAGRRLVDLLIETHQTLREQPCWRPPPAAALATIREPAPLEGEGLATALADAERFILPYATGNLHPRFWGWVLGGGTLPGILGQWMAAMMNANVFAGDQGPVHVERAVLDWFRTWFELPPDASGILTTGASMANLLGLAVARHHATKGAVKTEGPEATQGLRLYASEATHSSILKAAQLLGLGSRAVRLVRAVDERIDLTALADAVREDRDRGLTPFCVVANVGTVGIGALDPLDALREWTDRERLWLHADGAIGALGRLSPVLRAKLGDLSRVDSLAFDLHKWPQVPYDAGCLFVRDGEMHRAAFEVGAGYLGTVSGGFSPHDAHVFHAYSPLLSRGDRALKIWMTFKSFGTKRIGEVMEANVGHAAYLAKLVDDDPSLERLAPVELNIVCFRYVGDNAPADVDTLNERILIALQNSGFCMLSSFRTRGSFCLRVAISNHRTRRADLAELVERVVAEGRRLGGLQPHG